MLFNVFLFSLKGYSETLSNQKREIEPTIINLHLHEYSQGFHYYQFAVKLIDLLEIVILPMIYLIKYGF